MQDEAFRIQKDMFIRIQDLKLLDLSEDDIDNILKRRNIYYFMILLGVHKK